MGEFHEGMLLDALLQLYPSVAGKSRFPNYNDILEGGKTREVVYKRDDRKR